MKKTSEESKQHSERMWALLSQMREEQMVWFGWTDGMGIYVALGEYILELTDSDEPHDSWLVDARKSFLDWKKDHHIQLTPPANRKAG
jgi:hypothetical protein